MTAREYERLLEAECASLALDSAEDRKVCAAVLAKYDRRCVDCGHPEDVHVSGGCLGGPETHCDCQGFRLEE